MFTIYGIELSTVIHILSAEAHYAISFRQGIFVFPINFLMRETKSKLMNDYKVVLLWNACVDSLVLLFLPTKRYIGKYK
jgi:hypothetical protein